MEGGYPLVNVYITMERSTIFDGEIHYFDWAMFNSKLLVITRGYRSSVATTDFLYVFFFHTCQLNPTSRIPSLIASWSTPRRRPVISAARYELGGGEGASIASFTSSIKDAAGFLSNYTKNWKTYKKLWKIHYKWKTYKKLELVPSGELT